MLAIIYCQENPNSIARKLLMPVQKCVMFFFKISNQRFQFAALRNKIIVSKYNLILFCTIFYKLALYMLLSTSSSKNFYWKFMQFIQLSWNQCLYIFSRTPSLKKSKKKPHCLRKSKPLPLDWKKEEQTVY